MALANIELMIYGKDSDKTILLDSGSLRSVDNVISSFRDAESLKRSSNYQEKLEGLSNDEINRGKIVLTYIKNNNEKITIQPIYNDPNPILIKANALEDEKSEVEVARKLLFSSRNNLFLRMFLNNATLLRTTFFSMKVSVNEYSTAKANELTAFIKDGEYKVIMKDVLKYKLNHNKLGSMRMLYEDTLEEWKKRLLNLPSEDLYFYSRELRRLVNDYNYKKIPRRAVCNLYFNKKSLENIDTYNINKEELVLSSNTVGLYKKKILEDKKSS